MTHTSFIDGETLVLTVTLADADAAIIPPQFVQTVVCDTDTTTYATGDHSVSANAYTVEHDLTGAGIVRVTWTVVDDEGKTSKTSAVVLSKADRCPA